MQSAKDSEHPSCCVWKISSVMNQSLPHAFRESVRDVDIGIVISLLKLSGKYVYVHLL
jgi:hypothetical protein